MDANNINWVDPKTELPQKGRLCFIKRFKGHIYIGNRYSELEYSKHKDISQECFWWASPIDDDICNSRDDFHFHNHFNDQTVTGWYYVSSLIS